MLRRAPRRNLVSARLVRSHADGEVRGKALYAVSALTRNCKEAQSAFGAADGVGALLGVLAEGEGALWHVRFSYPEVETELQQLNTVLAGGALVIRDTRRRELRRRVLLQPCVLA